VASLATLILEAGTEFIVGDDTGKCVCYRIYDLCKDELELHDNAYVGKYTL
jgi:hypothetical protein